MKKLSIMETFAQDAINAPALVTGGSKPCKRSRSKKSKKCKSKSKSKSKSKCGSGSGNGSGGSGSNCGGYVTYCPW